MRFSQRFKTGRERTGGRLAPNQDSSVLSGSSCAFQRSGQMESSFVPKKSVTVDIQSGIAVRM